MKQTLLIILGLVITTSLWADDLSEEQARQIAAEFWTPDNDGNGSSETRRAAMRSAAAAMQLAYKSEANELYVLNKPEGGWVIVAGDDGAPTPILAFSDTGSFDYEKAPDIAKIIIGGYADSVRKLRQTSRRAASPATTIRRAGVTESIEPLLKTTWNQTTPYNNLCPIATNGGKEGYGGRCPAGCVPVAIAQVLNYWKWPMHGYGKHTNRNNSSQTADFTQSVYDWDNMLDSYAGEYNEKQAEAVAKLISDIGCAMNTEYKNGESGTFYETAKDYLFRYFDYHPDVISDWWKDAGIRGVSYADWLKAELRAKRPVICHGFVSVNESHAFVCDGFMYYEDGYYVGDEKRFNFFHINFGWGGQSDGYFADFDTEATFYTLNHWGAQYIGFRPNTLPHILKDNNYYLIRDQEAQLIGLAEEGSKDNPVKVIIHDQVEYNGKTYPVTSIYPELFRNTFVSEITFPKTMKRILSRQFINYAVGDCPLRRINLPEGIEEIGDSAFYDLRNLSDLISFPTTLRRIGDYAFYGTNISVVEFKGKGFEIGDYGLNSYMGMIVSGLEGAAKIGEHGISSLSGDFIISPTCQYSKSAINGKFNKIILPKGLTTYNPDMFVYNGRTAEYVVRKDNPNYTSVNGILFDKNQTTLLAYPCLEQSGSSLVDRKQIYIPVGVTTIGRRALAPGSDRVQIPASVKTLDGAFIDCTPRFLTVLATTPPVINDTTFITHMINSPGNPCKLIVPLGTKAAYQQANGWKDFQNIEEGDLYGILYVQGQYCYKTFGDEWFSIINRNCEVAFDGHAVIPATLTIGGVTRQISNIDEGAFWGDQQLKTVTIPKELESVDTHFTNCDNLYTINVEAGNSRLHSTDGMLFANVWGENTLQYCPPMQQQGSSIVKRDKVVIPEETKVIDSNAFNKVLKRVTIPASVERINQNAFAQCVNLKTVICLGTTPAAYIETGHAFAPSVYQTATLYVPKGCTAAYRNTWTGGFHDFVNMVEYDPATFDPNSIDDGDDEEEEPADPEFYDPTENPDEPGEADEPVIQDAVAVYRINGQVEYFAFDGRPTITYEGDNLVMTCGGNCVQYTLKGLEKISFTTIATGIGNLPELKQLTFSFSDDRIDVAGAKAGEPVRIYDTTGRMVDMLYTDGEGRQTISFSPMQKGVYIVQIGNTSYKLLKK